MVVAFMPVKLRLLVQVRVVGGDAEPRDVDGVVGELVAPGPRRRAGSRRRRRSAGSSRGGAAGGTPGARLSDVLDGELVLEVRVRIERAVVVVLDRDRGEHLAGRAVLVHVAGRERGEQHRGGLAAVEDRVAGRRRGRAAPPRRTCRASSRRRSRARRRARRWRRPWRRPGTRPSPTGTRSRPGCRRCRRGRGRSGRCCRRCPPGPTTYPRCVATKAASIVDGSKPLSTLATAASNAPDGHLLVALLEQLAELDQSGADDGDPIPAHERFLHFADRPRLVAVDGDAPLVGVAPQHELDVGADLEVLAVADDLQHHAGAVVEVDDRQRQRCDERRGHRVVDHEGVHDAVPRDRRRARTSRSRS